MTVLLSSHLMGEVEELCDRVAIVRGGRMIYEGDLAELMLATAERYELRTTDDVRAAGIARGRPGIADVERDAGDGPITFAGGAEAASALSLELAAAGIGIVALVPRRASLEELFFRMTEEVAA
jgi:ABC-2 type transport system ATP-binding protein